MQLLTGDLFVMFGLLGAAFICALHYFAGCERHVPLAVMWLTVFVLNGIYLAARLFVMCKG